MKFTINSTGTVSDDHFKSTSDTISHRLPTQYHVYRHSITKYLVSTVCYNYTFNCNLKINGDRDILYYVPQLTAVNLQPKYLTIKN